jgi:hypothetical protein
MSTKAEDCINATIERLAIESSRGCTATSGWFGRAEVVNKFNLVLGRN